MPLIALRREQSQRAMNEFFELHSDRSENEFRFRMQNSWNREQRCRASRAEGEIQREFAKSNRASVSIQPISLMNINKKSERRQTDGERDDYLLSKTPAESLQTELCVLFSVARFLLLYLCLSPEIFSCSAATKTIFYLIM